MVQYQDGAVPLTILKQVPRVREVLIPLPTVRGEPATKRQKIFHGVDYSKFEHIAGPDCGHQGGYNGSRIKPVEMAGCRTLQFLADKDDEDEWEPDDEALPFESYSRCFLTGLSDCARLHRTEVVPPRNDLDSPLLNDYIQVCIVELIGLKTLANILSVLPKGRSRDISMVPAVPPMVFRYFYAHFA